MKLFVQVPCLNEEQTLPLVLSSIPQKIPGIDSIELLIVDDGSSDRTVEVARKHGVSASSSGTHGTWVSRGRSATASSTRSPTARTSWSTPTATTSTRRTRSPSLSQPILAGRGGDRHRRPTDAHDRPLLLVQEGDAAARLVGGQPRRGDEASRRGVGFPRLLALLAVPAQHRHAVLVLHGDDHPGRATRTSPSRRSRSMTNPKTRESRLFSNMFEHMLKSGQAILRSYIMFKPWSVFAWLAGVFAIAGLVPVRAVRHPPSHRRRRQPPAIIDLRRRHARRRRLLSFALGVLSDLQRTNRILLEEQLERLKVIQFGTIPAPAARPRRKQ